jgi:hypothetical protein
MPRAGRHGFVLDEFRAYWLGWRLPHTCSRKLHPRPRELELTVTSHARTGLSEDRREPQLEEMSKAPAHAMLLTAPVHGACRRG